jgi:hypothetical protein
MQGTCREHAGNMKGTCREHAGNMQGTCREHAGDMQGTCREDAGNVSGITQGMFRECLGNAQRMFRGDLGNAQGIFRIVEGMYLVLEPPGIQRSLFHFLDHDVEKDCRPLFGRHIRQVFDRPANIHQRKEKLRRT